MRATMSGYYRNLNFDQNKVAKELFDVTKQISSGQKIQYGYEGVSTFVNSVRLDNEVTTLTQTKQNAQKALQFSTNTDTTMNEMSDILDAMKIKLIAAASDANSAASYKAIGAELRGLEENLRQLANTSIDGRFLFSGSLVNTKPIDNNGIYSGNDKDINAFVGSGVEQKYNITGKDLFFGAENDTKRKITTNISFFNQRLLNPDVMVDPNLTVDASKEVNLTENDSIRDMMGDDDEIIDPSLPKHKFYIRGTDRNGVAFKDIVSLTDTDTVSDLFDKIGSKFGNTPNNKFVNITMNKAGQIEIEDTISGSSKLDFNIMGSTSKSFDTPLLVNGGGAPLAANEIDVPIGSLGTIFQEGDSIQINAKTYIIGTAAAGVHPTNVGLEVISLTENIQGGVLSTPTEAFKSTRVGSEAIPYDTAITGTRNLATPNEITVSTAGQVQVNDIVKIEDEEYTVNAVAGTTVTLDRNVNYDFALGAVAVEKVIARQNPFTLDIKEFINSGYFGGGDEYDAVKFETSGNQVLSDAPQILKSDNSFATALNKLSEVASGTSINGKTLKLEGIDINGALVSTTLYLNNYTPAATPPSPPTLPLLENAEPPGVSFTLNGQRYQVYDTAFNDLNTNGVKEAGEGKPQSADDMTYKQLLDVMNMIFSGNLPTALAVSGAHPRDANDYDTAIKNANSASTSFLDDKGRVVFEQNNVATTQAEISMYDGNSADFTEAASSMNFQTNNALSIRDAKTDFFGQINEAISSVELGRMRSNGEGTNDKRNLGIQNSIQLIDDMAEHLANQQSVAGVQSQTLQTTEDRTDLLIITTQSLRSQTLDVDIAEASLRLQQLTLNYQAMLSTVSRVSQLSLVNFL
ncbi:hypothetical protein JHD50_07975 [Sulfurimonas sp. MAG313]|nr:hypothetical protein [Sulfurimonas sp. MAG313]MDF1881238.1 hypothetical protein [Sulfurimonas sp. MAG313]